MSPVEAQIIMTQLAAIREDITGFKTEVRDDLQELKTQAKETNGRVKSIELWKASVEGFRRGVGFSFQWLPVVVASVITGLVMGAIATFTPIL